MGSAVTTKLLQIRKDSRAVGADYNLASALIFHLSGIGGHSIWKRQSTGRIVGRWFFKGAQNILFKYLNHQRTARPI